MLRDESKGDSVVSDFGPTDAGFKKIRSQFILDQENKVAAETLENWIRRWRDPGW
jgi:hypothetical protein